VGVKTRVVLIGEALELAGNTSLTLRAEQWIDMALVRLSMGAPWPFLMKRANIAVTAGSSSFILGNGTGTSARVARINRVTYTDSTGFRGTLDALVQAENLDAADDPSINTLITNGAPAMGYLSNVTDAFDWRVSFDRKTDKAYTFVAAHQIIHAVLTGDSDVPQFPNDRTIVQALIVEAMFHAKDERYLTAAQMLRDMISEDMVAMAQASTTSPNIGLANHSATTGKKSRSSWMGD
jgi:hypothetical protein